MSVKRKHIESAGTTPNESRLTTTSSIVDVSNNVEPNAPSCSHPMCIKYGQPSVAQIRYLTELFETDRSSKVQAVVAQLPIMDLAQIVGEFAQWTVADLMEKEFGDRFIRHPKSAFDDHLHRDRAQSAIGHGGDGHEQLEEYPFVTSRGQPTLQMDILLRNLSEFWSVPRNSDIRDRYYDQERLNGIERYTHLVVHPPVSPYGSAHFHWEDWHNPKEAVRGCDDSVYSKWSDEKLTTKELCMSTEWKWDDCVVWGNMCVEERYEWYLIHVPSGQLFMVAGQHRYPLMHLGHSAQPPTALAWRLLKDDSELRKRCASLSNPSNRIDDEELFQLSFINGERKFG